MAQVIWVWVIRVSLRRWERPTSLQFFEDKIGIGRGHIKDTTIFPILASVTWSLWKTRNDYWVFNDHLIKSSKAIAYEILGFLLQWKKLLKQEEVKKLEDAIVKLQEGLSTW